MNELLRCRIRYFSEGLAIRSQAFVDSNFDRYRERFGPKRWTGARPMRFGDWPGLCTLRDLRLEPVTRPKLSEEPGTDFTRRQPQATAAVCPDLAILAHPAMESDHQPAARFHFASFKPPSALNNHQEGNSKAGASIGFR